MDKHTGAPIHSGMLSRNARNMYAREMIVTGTDSRTKTQAIDRMNISEGA